MRRRKLNKSPVLGFCGFVIGYECKEKGIKLMECDKAQADANHSSSSLFTQGNEE